MLMMKKVLLNCKLNLRKIDYLVFDIEINYLRIAIVDHKPRTIP
jgi:hypothetical protein